MYLGGPAPLPGEYRFLELEERGLQRERPDDFAERILVAVDCASPGRVGAEPGVVDAATLTVNIDHHHDNPRFGDVNLIVSDASSTGEVLADVFRELGVTLTPAIAEALYIALVTDTGRFQYANTTPKALRLAADLVEAGADVNRVFQGVYENVQFAKLKLLARALERAHVLEGGEIVVSHLVRGDFEAVGATEPYSEGIIDVLRSVEGSLVSALIREPPRDGGPARKVSLRSSVDEIDVSAIARKSQGGGHRAAAGFSSDLSVEELTEFIVREVAAQVGSAARLVPPRAQHPSGIILVDKPAGPTSFDIVAATRRRTGARTGHAGTLDPFATGLLLLLSGASTRLQSRFVGLPKRYVTEIDLSARTSTGDLEGERVDEHDAARGGRARGGARAASRRGRPPDSGRVGREDRGRARVRAPSAGRRGRDAGAHDARPRAHARALRRTASRGSTCSSRRGRTSARSPSASAGTASRCGGPRSGRSASRRPIRSGSSRPTRRSRGSGARNNLQLAPRTRPASRNGELVTTCNLPP